MAPLPCLRLLVLTGALLVFGTFQTLAQTPYFQKYYVGNGLDPVGVQAIAQDQTGYLWLGTRSGLYRFDGIDYELLAQDSAITSSSITAIYQDAESQLWVGYQNGQLGQLQQGVVVLVEGNEGSAMSEVSAIITDAEGKLWYATKGDGLYYLKKSRLYRIDDTDGLPDLFIYDLELLSNGQLVAGTDGGLAFINTTKPTDTITVLDYAQGLPDNIIKSITRADSLLYLGTEDAGVLAYHLSSGTLTYPFEGMEGQLRSVTDMRLVDAQLWVGTARKGLVVLDLLRNKRSYYNSAGAESLRGVEALFEDSQHNLWVASRRALYRLAGSHVVFTPSPLGLEAENIVDLAADQEGNLWYLNDQGLHYYAVTENNQAAAVPVALGAEVKQSVLISLYIDQRGILWLGTYGEGVITYDPASKTVNRYEEELANGNIINISGDGANVWLSTLGGATKVVHATDRSLQFANYTERTGLKSNYLYDVLVDQKGHVWFGSDGEGITILDADNNRVSTRLDSLLADEVVYSLVQDASGAIWINTKDQGILCYTGDSLISFQDRLRSNTSDAIAITPQGSFVAINPYGLDVLFPERHKQYYLGEELGIWRSKGNLNAVAAMPDGSLYFGTNTGLLYYSAALKEAIFSPDAHIEGLYLYGDSSNYRQAIPENFNYNQNNLRIDYLGFWYLNPNHLHYRYQLEGYDQDWIYSKNRSVTYSNLPPGSYQFKVQTATTADFSSPAEASLQISITPPFWQTLWFYLLCLLILIVGILAFIRLRERKLKADKRLLEQKVEARTEEIRKKNEVLSHQRDQIQEQHHEILEKSEELQATLEELTSKNDSITQSINYAKRIQQAILPLEEQLDQQLGEYFIFFKPRDIVSGDFYFYYEVQNHHYIAAVDCTGHGVPGAFMSMIGFVLLKEIITSQPGIAPAQLLRLLNSGVVEALRQKTGQGTGNLSNDGMELSICHWQDGKQELTFSGAKRPLWYIRNNEIHEIKGQRKAIGGKSIGKAAAYEFEDHTLQLQPGDQLYLLSDGLPDQFGGPEGRKLGSKALQKIFLESSSLSAKAQAAEIETRMENWMKDQRQIDDMLLISLRF